MEQPERSKEEKEQHRSAVKIRSALENMDLLVNNIPNLKPEMKEDIIKRLTEVKKEILPFVQDAVKSIFTSTSENLGTGKGKKTWVVQNSKDGLEFLILKNVVSIDCLNGKEDIELKFPLQKIYDRIDKYEKPESLIADMATGRLFSIKDYEIDKLPAPDHKAKLISGEVKAEDTNHEEIK